MEARDGPLCEWHVVAQYLQPEHPFELAYSAPETMASFLKNFSDAASVATSRMRQKKTEKKRDDDEIDLRPYLDVRHIYLYAPERRDVQFEDDYDMEFVRVRATGVQHSAARRKHLCAKSSDFQFASQHKLSVTFWLEETDWHTNRTHICRNFWLPPERFREPYYTVLSTKSLDAQYEAFQDEAGKEYMEQVAGVMYTHSDLAIHFGAATAPIMPSSPVIAVPTLTSAQPTARPAATAPEITHVSELVAASVLSEATNVQDKASPVSLPTQEKAEDRPIGTSDEYERTISWSISDSDDDDADDDDKDDGSLSDGERQLAAERLLPEHQKPEDHRRAVHEFFQKTSWQTLGALYHRDCVYVPHNALDVALQNNCLHVQCVTDHSAALAMLRKARASGIRIAAKITWLVMPQRLAPDESYFGEFLLTAHSYTHAVRFMHFWYANVIAPRERDLAHESDVHFQRPAAYYAWRHAWDRRTAGHSWHMYPYVNSSERLAQDGTTWCRNPSVYRKKKEARTPDYYH